MMVSLSQSDIVCGEMELVEIIYFRNCIVKHNITSDGIYQIFFIKTLHFSTHSAECHVFLINGYFSNEKFSFSGKCLFHVTTPLYFERVQPPSKLVS